MGAEKSADKLEIRTLYEEAIKRYVARKFEWNDAPDPKDMHWLQERAQGGPLKDEDVEKIRSSARKTLEVMNENYGDDPEDIFNFDVDGPRLASWYAYICLMRDVVTPYAIRYFENLRAYLRARETGDADIDEIRNRVASAAHILLQQIEGVVPNFSPSERTAGGTRLLQANLHTLIDMKRVHRETGFSNLFQVSDINHFEGVISPSDGTESKSLGVSENSHSGIRPLDILTYLNRAGDVSLHNKKNTDATNPFATIHADGTVDAFPQDGLHLKSGLSMTLDKVPADAQTKLSDRIVFSSRAEMVDGVELTREVLEKNGLLPAWCVTFGNNTVYLPDKLYISDQSNSRLRTIIYVEDEKRGLVARSCYKSNSHCVWKILPAYDRGHYYKEQGEEQLTLLPELQRSIAYLCSVERLKEADLVFFGTTREGHGLATSFEGDVHAKPVELGSGFDDRSPYDKVVKVSPDAPTSFHFNDEEDKPNYTQVIDSWTEETVLYGGVTFEVIASLNGRLRYLFCRNKDGKAWIAGIDLEGAEMTSQGLKKDWVYAGDLCTPAYDYWEQTGRYASRGCGVEGYGGYADMFENYLSKIPIIREYLSSVAAREK